MRRFLPTPLEAARHVLQGFLMGSADVVPGVSGGTMALIVGIYRRLIDSIDEAASAAYRLPRGDIARARAHLSAVEWGLILPLGVGILAAIAVGAQVIPHFLDERPEESRALFFGLIAGSIAIPWRRIGEHSARTVALLVAGAVAAFFFAGLPDREVADPSLLRVFASAALAICAMILPGVSGAFLLLVMGMYEPTLDAVHERDMLYLGVFGLGALSGLAAFSSLLRWLLDRANDLAMAALVGLMAGSLRALWPYLDEDRGLRTPAGGDPVATVVMLAVAGAALVMGLAWLGERAMHRRLRAAGVAE